MDWTSDSEENDNYKWESSDGEKEPAACGSGSKRPATDQEWEAIPGPSMEASEAGPSRPNLISHFVGMGFSEEMVVKAIRENGEENTETILETLLTYGAIEESPRKRESSPANCSSASEKDDLEDDLSDVGDFGSEESFDDFSEKDKIVSTLVDMGFLAEEASLAIDRCGPDASVLELADSIHAARMAEEFDGQLWEPPESSSAEDESYAYNSFKDKKRRVRPKEEKKSKRGRFYEQKKECMRKVSMGHDDDAYCSLSIPNPMVGFGLPFERARITHRNLPDAAIGPPYFYYENVALAPKGVWETISRFLYDIEPEFVDSKFFSAAARKRGYIHNLPITNRFPLLPVPPKTIHEAFPLTKKWWPSWDSRTKLNCLQTCIASAKLTERIRTALAQSDDPPPHKVQQYVLNECRKWNLVWVGLHKAAPLEPDEIEMLLGFPKNHTRGGGSSRTERYKSLGNSFQVDTVAYHLSVLRDMFPNGITVLSLFSGIGGAEVALHRLGIRLKTVVSVELSESNRNIVRCWWEQTNQTGNLIDFADVQQLNGDRLEQLINTYGGFDLVIGGSPCNNLAGSNRHSRDGLEGKHSALFYDYFRILDLVKCIMAKNL